MQVRLLGTGSADRWPNPWCSCPNCRWARQTGALRDRTSALVEGVLLIDPGPDAGSRGVDLSGVRTVLVTHAHPDHLDPAFLLAWTWAAEAASLRGASAPEPLVVAGPAEAVETCRPWVAPDSSVDFRALRPGDILDAGALRVRALTAAHSTRGGAGSDGTALLFEVAGPGGRLLYATDTAALPHGELTGRYDIVALEQTFGAFTEHGTAHLDLPGFAREVGRLRRDGRIDSGSQVVAVHLSHHNGAGLAGDLAAVGAVLLPDGAVLDARTAGPTQPAGSATGRPAAPAPATGHPQGTRGPRTVLVTGGARSGKSHHAEAIAAAHPGPVTYVATAPAYPGDPEWDSRIEAHRARRPEAWQTVETAAVAGVLAAAGPRSLVLVDCLTLWLTATLDRIGWEHPGAADEVAAEIGGLVAALAGSPASIVLVTNEVGSGLVPETASGRLFRDLLGRANAEIAAACDRVDLVTCGVAQTIKAVPADSRSGDGRPSHDRPSHDRPSTGQQQGTR